MNEPIYVDDPFEEEDHWWKPDSGTRRLDLLWLAMGATGRSKFASKKERRQWLSIESKLEKKQLTEEWVITRIEWARDKNKGRLIIRFDVLLKYILNMGKYQDWINERSKNIPFDRSEYKNL